MPSPVSRIETILSELNDPQREVAYMVLDDVEWTNREVADALTELCRVQMIDVPRVQMRTVQEWRSGQTAAARRARGNL